MRPGYPGTPDTLTPASIPPYTAFRGAARPFPAILTHCVLPDFPRILDAAAKMRLAG